MLFIPGACNTYKNNDVVFNNLQINKTKIEIRHWETVTYKSYVTIWSVVYFTVIKHTRSHSQVLTSISFSVILINR